MVFGVINGVIAGHYSHSRPFLAIASASPRPSSSSILGVVVRTPPFPVVVAYTGKATDDFVARTITKALYEVFGTEIGGFNCDTRIIDPYIRHWCEITDAKPYVYERTRIYKATRVTAPKRVRGRPRRATADDYATVLKFLTEFFKEAHPQAFDEKQCRELANQYLDDNAEVSGVLLWLEDEEVVSMAAYLGPAPHGIRVNAVYTKPHRRKHGYARACVATLTQLLFDAGRQYCFLFTNLANPTSSKIYQEIGYVPVSSQIVYRFEPSQ